MIDYGSEFFYNGHWTSEFGLFVNPHGDFGYPKRKTNKIEIPGSNRSIVMFDGFEDVEETFDMMLLPDKDRSIRQRAFDVIGWLYGTQEYKQLEYKRFEYSQEPDYFRLGYYDGDGKREDRFAITGLMEATFVFRPERWLKSGEDKGSPSNPNVVCGTLNNTVYAYVGTPGPLRNSVYNPTQYISKPLLGIDVAPDSDFRKAGTLTLTAESGNTYQIGVIADFENAENKGRIILDCDTGNAYANTDHSYSYNPWIVFDGKMPVFEPGITTLSTTGFNNYDSSVSIRYVPRWYVY